MSGDSCALDAMEVDVAGIDAQLAVVLSYDGAPFAGFARQPGRTTVQGDLEHAFSLALRRPVEVVCAGRTDAGVHARGQVVSFPITRAEAEERSLRKLKRSFQALTDDAITVQTLSVMPPEFSARFSAVEREYRYLLVPGERHPLFLRDWCWDVRHELDVNAMNRAAAWLVGEHDFKSFCLAASAEGKNTVRELRRVDVVPVNVLGEEALSVRVVGTAFLHSMVRSIVGTLVAVGSGRRDPAWVAEVLAARDRRAAGENAPAKGLVFWRVSYRGGVPCYEADGAPGVDELWYAGTRGRNTGEAAPSDGEKDEKGENGVSEQDVALAEVFMSALEEAETTGEDVAMGGSSKPNAAFADAALGARFPKAVEAAAVKQAAHGFFRKNEVAGPAIEAAARTRRVAPADPQPAEGEVSFSFEVPRDSAASRAIKRQKRARKGLFDGLFSKKSDKRDGDDA